MSVKLLQVQSLSVPDVTLIVLKGRRCKAFGSIRECFLIEKLNFPRAFPTVIGDHSDYWCYIQVSVRYSRSDAACRHFFFVNTAFI
jgi:hypothetical protein